MNTVWLPVNANSEWGIEGGTPYRDLFQKVAKRYVEQNRPHEHNNRLFHAFCVPGRWGKPRG